MIIVSIMAILLIFQVYWWKASVVLLSKEKILAYVYLIYSMYGPELLNVSIRRIRLNSRILLNKKNRRKFNL